MKMKKITLPVLTVALFAIGMASCKNKDVETKIIATDSIVVSKPFINTHFTFYSLKEGNIVPVSDSATTKWDFGINVATLIFNSHASGPGEAGVIVQTGNYESFTTAPASGYAYDTTKTKLAVNSTPMSPNAWYIYEPTTHAFTPKAGQFFVIKTADGHYAKMEVLRVDYGDYPQGSMFPNELIYRIRYTYQTNGSLNLN